MDLTPSNKNLVHTFVRYCATNLGIHEDIRIVLATTHAGDYPSAGGFDPVNKVVHVFIKHRAIADVLRTIAHELTHMKQLVVDNAGPFPTDDTGLQPFEDEANVMSGRLVRFFGRKNKTIYADLA